MREKRFLHVTIPGWLKWVLGIVIFLIAACLAFGIYLYQVVEDNRTANFEDVKTQVIEQTELNSISKIERFHGENAYYTVYGETENNSDMIIFYPFNGNTSNIIRINQSEIISEQKIRNDWYNRCYDCTLSDIKPGVISNDGDQPVWELTYKNNKNQYVMEYLSLQDGSTIEVVRFNQLFD
ncbi:hypothetical protein GCM10007063_04950 [Lentibacillus kapialis]|uniref:Cell wall elongation regulator TseB-like domain-containing protein n=1 Tax=Lentibacillus kapialis TaxID=340214 RepID=A0A917PN59_9BACI|nr:DUF5590 domain-containing protein [Lentibacillus kapialis]GGJ85445.1 hypothetical protein GCM10007063_04950 [Lentibacillus kapialis]